MASGFQNASKIPDFRDLPPKQLDTFIAQHLQPDEQFHTLVSGAMDSLCRYLQGELKPDIKRMVKSGSMGKGTALKNSSDLDCILIMNTIKDAEQLRDKIYSILAQIQSLLKGQPLEQQGWYLTIIKVDEYLLQFEMRSTKTSSGKSVKVDLLPTFDANVTNEDARNKLYEIMPSLNKLTRTYCSAALAELQRDFVIERPAKLKSLIRLVKHWAKTFLPSSTRTRMPSSFLIELVTIHFWEQNGSPSSFNTADLFKAVMVGFSKHANLNISWNRYYILQQARSPPSILDPANPHNNLYHLVTDWAKVAQVAQETLQKPPVTKASVSCNKSSLRSTNGFF